MPILHFSPDACIQLGGDLFVGPDTPGWRPYDTCQIRALTNKADCYTRNPPCLGTQYKGVDCHSYCMNLGASTEADCVGNFGL